MCEYADPDAIVLRICHRRSIIKDQFRALLETARYKLPDVSLSRPWQEVAFGALRTREDEPADHS